jgi:hypothetical protein
MFFHGIPRNLRTKVIFEIVRKIYDILSGGEIVFSSENEMKKNSIFLARSFAYIFLKYKRIAFFGEIYSYE